MTASAPMALLGGRPALGTRPRSASDWHKLIGVGVPSSAAEALRKALGLPDDQFFRLIGISEKTLSRSRKAKAALDPVIGDRVYRLARTAALAAEVLESEDAARSWLGRPQAGLGGQVPLDMMETSAGTDEVERLLLRIEHGVYS